MKRKLQNRFCELFGADGDIRFYFSPGRVNLIGEHTDYNGGHVFPCALTNGTYGAARIRNDRKLRLYSENFSNAGVFETSLDDLAYHDRAGWTNYLKGVIWTFCSKGYPVERGLDLVIGGNIPNGSGLSSSASIELLMAMVLKDLFGFSDMSKTDMALFGQYAENKFCGMNCGIMDQFTVAMGKKGHAINYNKMRVIAGSAKSMPLKTIPGTDTRPTTDRIKETLFNMLQPYLCDCRFLDIFSGSGAIGIEALSRGAYSCVFIEKNKKAAECIRENLKFTRLADSAELYCQDVFSALGVLEGSEPFGCIFMDPPYNRELEKQVLSVLSKASYVDEDTLIVVEASLETPFDYLEEYGFTMVKDKRYKTNRHIFLRKA